ncbi:MAG: uracil-DNA glycosylase family protein [Prevotella sp.]|nr:uracil-DNA glycosylase family protein [Prevotella sp.]
MTIEEHPLKPFLPAEGRILFLGSFPPPKARWSMEFFYPNWINDFWRLMGLIHFGDKTYFEVSGEKRFDRERIIGFAERAGLAFYDTAAKVCRHKDNASDNFLEILEPADIATMLSVMPRCHTVVTTGGKASEELQAQLSAAICSNGQLVLSNESCAQTQQLVPMPAIGESVELDVYGRCLRWWRMPSSSRAYPLKLEKKAELYRRLFV